MQYHSFIDILELCTKTQRGIGNFPSHIRDNECNFELYKDIINYVQSKLLFYHPDLFSV